MVGLDKKTVTNHLDIAENNGWIEVSQHGYRGQKWKRNEYVARWPDRDFAKPPQMRVVKEIHRLCGRRWWKWFPKVVDHGPMEMVKQLKIVIVRNRGYKQEIIVGSAWRTSNFVRDRHYFTTALQQASTGLPSMDQSG